jgi:hypothetical protein
MAAPDSVYDIRSAVPGLIVGSQLRLPVAALGLLVGAGVGLLLAGQIGTAATVATAAMLLVAPVAVAKSATACGMNALASFGRYDLPVSWRALDAIVFVTVSSVTATLLGVMLAVVGGLIGLANWLAPVGVICLYFGLRDLGFLGIPRVPSSMWQVPARWVVHPHRGAVVWGFFLGSGLATQMPYPSFYALLLVVATLPVPLGAAVMGLYGFTRALPGVVAAFAPSWAGTPDALAMFRFRLFGHATTGIGCLVLAGALLVLAGA